MQIISGACLFVSAIILLAYMPGKLLFMALKRTLSPLEDVTLACFLGLVVSGLAYWLITYANEAHFFFLWPIGTAALFVWLYASKTKTVWRHSPNAWDYRAGVSAFLLRKSHAARGWDDVRLSGT
jgi:hypothetical protein